MRHSRFSGHWSFREFYGEFKFSGRINRNSFFYFGEGYFTVLNLAKKHFLSLVTIVTKYEPSDTSS